MGLPSSWAADRIRLNGLDAALALAAPFLARLARDIDAFTRDDVMSTLVYAGVTAATMLVSLVYFRVGGIVSDYVCTADVRRIGKAVLVGVLTGVVFLFSFWRLDEIPRSIPLLHVILLSGLLVGWRVAFPWLKASRAQASQRRSGVAGPARPEESVLLIGANRMALLYIRMLAALEGRRPRIIGLLDDNPKMQGRSVAGYPVVAGTEKLAAVVGEYATHGVRISRVVLMVTGEAESQDLAERLAPECERLGLHLDPWANRLREFQTSEAELRPQMARIANRAGEFDVPNPGYWGFRRGVDIALSIAGLCLLAPVAGLVILAVVIDVGMPIIFWQERLGQYGRPIRVYKFRTLRLPLGAGGRRLSDEERLSSTGRFLRATRLDEIPQLVNIMAGDMTIVGPRPLLPVDQPRNDRSRLAVRPGLTGWAQVKGGKLITPEEKNALDKWYVRHAGPMLDLKILVLTVVAVIRGDIRDHGALEAALDDGSFGQV
jgi:lipopolysaccharide/colanic/teichoic acid biosynthesis glycosyltransferase